MDNAVGVRLVERVGDLMAYAGPARAGWHRAASLADRVSPWTYSMTRKSMPSWWPMS